ncbi:MAG: hypothetical protein V4725_15035 [Bacteroidota bacterium]|nr:hypothetical protein [Ferruginibacter sp.]
MLIDILRELGGNEKKMRLVGCCANKILNGFSKEEFVSIFIDLHHH